MSNSLDPDQAHRFFRPDLDPDYLQKLSEEDTDGQILPKKKRKKQINVCLFFSACYNIGCSAITNAVIYIKKIRPKATFFSIAKATIVESKYNIMSILRLKTFSLPIGNTVL